MLKLLKLETIKALKASTFIIIILTIQQTIGLPLMNLKYMGDVENIYQYIYSEIFLGSIVFYGYLGIALLSAYSISIELQEKSLQSQIANGLSRASYFKAKMGFFYIIGILLLLMLTTIHSLLIYYSFGFDLKWMLHFKSMDILMVLICFFPFISIGLIVGLYAKPFPSIGIILLILIFEWAITFFDTIFWEIGLHRFLLIKTLSSYSDNIFLIVLKLVYILILVITARYLIKNKDFS